MYVVQLKFMLCLKSVESKRGKVDKTQFLKCFNVLVFVMVRWVSNVNVSEAYVYTIHLEVRIKGNNIYIYIYKS